MDERLTPDFVMVRALEGIGELSDKVWPLQPKKNAIAPFAFYIQTDDTEEEALDRMTGLQHTGYALHVVSDTYYGLAVIGGHVKAAITALSGRSWARADSGVCDAAVSNEIVADTGGERLLIEDVSIRQVSPDLFEEDVFLYRRIYQIDMDYQTERSVST